MYSVVIVDYGMGNLRSVEKALNAIGTDYVVKISGEPSDVLAADKIVFPGQGAMPDCMRELEVRGLANPVRQAAKTKPFLVICIGLQLLFERSDEGDVDGLGILSGSVRKLVPDIGNKGSEKFKVPHMGWNKVKLTREHVLFEGIEDNDFFYFVHSFYANPKKSEVVLGTTDYCNNFVSAVAQDNLVAVQFHPEKSQRAGLRLLSNFLDWSGD